MPSFGVHTMLLTVDDVRQVAYFWERDVYSDDPFTEPVEPAQPFALGVMVRNLGNGTARNMQIVSNQVCSTQCALLCEFRQLTMALCQPEIVDNQKGLAVTFQILATQVCLTCAREPQHMSEQPMHTRLAMKLSLPTCKWSSETLPPSPRRLRSGSLSAA